MGTTGIGWDGSWVMVTVCLWFKIMVRFECAGKTEIRMPCGVRASTKSIEVENWTTLKRLDS